MRYTYKKKFGALPVSQFIDKIENREILLPEFQRNYKWQKKGAEKFISNLNDNIFLPPIILFLFDGKTYILDGQQRLTSLLCHRHKIFPNNNTLNLQKITEHIKNKDIDRDYDEWNNRNFENYDLSTIELSYVLLYHVLPDERQERIFYTRVFQDINEQGVILENEEVRKSIYWLYRKDSTGASNIPLVSDREDITRIQVNNQNIDWLRYLAFIGFYRAQFPSGAGADTIYTSNVKKISTLKKDIIDESKWIEFFIREFIHSYYANTPGSYDLFDKGLSKQIQASWQNKFLEYISKPGIKTTCQKISSHYMGDLYIFGLLYHAILNKTISSNKIKTCLDKIEAKKTKKDSSHTSGYQWYEASEFKHIIFRMIESINIWKEAFNE